MKVITVGEKHFSILIILVILFENCLMRYIECDIFRIHGA